MTVPQNPWWAQLELITPVACEDRRPERRPIADRVQDNEVLEYWVQQYVSENPDRFGLTGLEGPFDTGPDFKAKVKGIKGRVGVEVEVLFRNYVKHGHPDDPRWDNVRVLIVLEEGKPDEAIRAKLPKKILQVDKVHFTEWYSEAARAYAIMKEQERAATDLPIALRQNLVRLHVIGGRVHRNWLDVCPDKERDMATCPECNLCPYFGEGIGEAREVFEDIALRFLQERNAPADLNLGDIPLADVDAFCDRVFQGG